MRNILVEVSPINKSTGLPQTLRMSAAWADATGVNVNGQSWLPLVVEGPRQATRLFSEGSPSEIEISHGDITFNLHADFGNLGWSNLYWSGAQGKVWVGEMGAAFGDYQQVFEGTFGPLKRARGMAQVALLGPDAVLDTPLLTSSYAGTGGAEGGAELKGALRPFAIGNCQNVDPRLVNAVYWVFQVHGYGAVQSIDKVYENALDLGVPVADYADYAALIAATLADGTWATCKAAGMFRLANEPTGKITADVSGALDGGSYANTVAEIGALLLKTAGVAAGKIDQTSLNAFSGTDWCFYTGDSVTVGDVLRAMFYEAGGYCFASSTGVWKAGNWFTNKTAGSLTENRSSLPLLLSHEQLEAAAPFYRVRVGGNRCWSTHDTSQISPILLDADAGITGYLTNESHLVAANSAGTINAGELAAAGGTFHVLDGTTSKTGDASVTYAVGSSTNVTASIAATGVYSITALSADTGTVTFTASYNGVQISKVYSLAKARAGADGTGSKIIKLTSTHQTFVYDASNSPLAQTATFTAALTNPGSGTTRWTVSTTGGTVILLNQTATQLQTSTYFTRVSDDEVTMTHTQFNSFLTTNGGNGVIVEANYSDASTIKDKVSAIKVREGATGASAVVAFLTNEAHTVAAAPDGTVSSFTGAGGSLKVYLGNTEVTGSSTFSVVSETGVDVSITAGGVYSVNSMSADTGTAVLRATYSGVNYDLTYSIAKSKQGNAGLAMTVLSDRQLITFTNTGTANPAVQTITFTAVKSNSTSTVNWTVADQAGVNRTPVTSFLSAASGDSVTMTVAQFESARQTTQGVIVTGTTADGLLTDKISIVRSVAGLDGSNGAAGISAYLSNEAHTVAADKDGLVASFSAAGGTFNIIQGGTSVAGSTTFSVVSSTSVTISINASGVYSITAMSADYGYATLRAAYGGVNYDRTYSIAKARAGATGTTGPTGVAVSAVLQPETMQVPSYANGQTVAYSGIATTMALLAGTTDVSSSFTLTIQANPQALTTSITNRTVTVTSAATGAGQFGNNAVTDASLTIRATGSGSYAGVIIDKVFTLSKVKGGYEIVTANPSTNLFEGRIVFNTTDDKLYHYFNGAWVPLIDTTTSINASQLADATIAATKFASSIAPVATHNSATLPTSYIQGTLYNTFDGKLYRWNGSGYVVMFTSTDSLPAGQISGQLTNAQLAAIDAAKVSGQLTDAQLAAISAAKITGTLTDTQLAAISAAKITGQITSTQITDNSITTAKINAGAVTAGKIAADTITANEIAANAITSTELAAGSVVAGKIAALSIVAGDIAASTITGAKIAANTISASNLVAATITANEIAANTITAAKIAANTITASQIAANTITAGQLAANTITASQIAANTITAGQIAAGAIGANQIAADAIVTSKLLVKSNGASMNPDPNTEDVTAWTGGGTSIVTDSSSPTGKYLSMSANDFIRTPLMPIDRLKNYALSMWLKQISGSSTSYLTVAFYNSVGGVVFTTYGWSAQGSYNYWGLVNQSPPASWTEYKIQFGPNEVNGIPATATHCSIGILANYTGSGVQAMTGIRLKEKVDANLVVDGAIAANKLAVSAVTENLVTNPRAELLTTFGWSQSQSSSASNALVATTGFASTSGRTGFYIYKPTVSDYTAYACRKFRIEAGKTYSFRGIVYGGAATASGLYLRFCHSTSEPTGDFVSLTDSGSTYGTDYIDYVSNAAMSASPTVIEFTFTAPAGKNWSSLHVYNWVNGSTVLWFGELEIREAKQAVHIQDGAITAAKVAANAITADKVQAGAITAAKLAVTSLDAITANIGLLRTATSGARTEIESNQIRVYDSSGTLRVRMGVWP